MTPTRPNAPRVASKLRPPALRWRGASIARRFRGAALSLARGPYLPPSSFPPRGLSRGARGRGPPVGRARMPPLERQSMSQSRHHLLNDFASKTLLADGVANATWVPGGECFRAPSRDCDGVMPAAISREIIEKKMSQMRHANHREKGDPEQRTVRGAASGPWSGARFVERRAIRGAARDSWSSARFVEQRALVEQRAVCGAARGPWRRAVRGAEADGAVVTR
jgi:hypothetical protein